MSTQRLKANDIPWDGHVCPVCGDTVLIGCMSLCCTCDRCGTFYADVNHGRGWYRSSAAYYAGEQSIAP